MKKSEWSLHCNGFVEDGEDIWFWDTRYNMLVKGKIGCEDVEVVLKVKRDTDGLMYGKVAEAGKKLVGIPYVADEILLYDMQTGEIDFIPLDILDWKNEKAGIQGKFFDCIVTGEEVFLIGFWSPYVLRLNVNEKRVTGRIDLYACGHKQYQNYPMLKHAVLCEDRIIVTDYYFNYVYKIDVTTMETTAITVPLSNAGYADLDYDGENIWLAPREAEGFIKWNLKKDCFSMVDKYPNGYVLQERGNISEIIISEGKIWSVPNRASGIISIDVQTNEISLRKDLDAYYDALEEHDWLVKYAFVQRGKNGKIYFLCNDTNCLLEYDASGGTLKSYMFYINGEQWCELYGDIISEDEDVNLKDLVAIQKRKERYARQYSSQGGVGEKIYSKVVL